MMKVNAIKCPKCKDTIFSRARHDFRSCSCDNIFIDGGFDYIRVGGDGIETIKVFELEIEQTKGQLWDDWNYQDDHYGIIKEKKS